MIRGSIRGSGDLVSLFDIGPDTVTLVRRLALLDDQDRPVIGAHGLPVTVEDRVEKTRCSWAQHPATEEVAGTQVAVIRAVGHLVVDADTRALAATDAVEFAGRLFEMQGPGIARDDLDGGADHVRAEAIWADDVSIGEQVFVIAAGRRDDDGNYGSAGAPVPLVSRAVTAGNTTRRFGNGGELVAAEFTVVLDLDAPVTGGDWIVVRGRQCRVLIQEQLSEWVARNQLVVLALSVTGGL